jgi:SAM-dependent methyltransferase
MLPNDLAQTIRAFQASRVLLTAIELDLFSAVDGEGNRDEGATADEVAGRLGTDPRATEILLNALVALETLEKNNGVFRNSPVAARLLTGGAPDSERLAWMHTVHTWDSWSTLTECVRTGTAAGRKEIAKRGWCWIEAFIAAMDRNAASRAPLLVKAVGTEGVRRMLDIGGGSAGYSPKLHADVLDVPEVLPIAQHHIEEAGLSDRVAPRPGDLRADRFGEGYDLVLLSAICHMLGPEENRDLLRRCREALAPRGRIVIQDFILESDKTAPRTSALFALNMLVATANGNSYSEQEYTAWLREASFQDIHRVEMPEPTALILATRPPERGLA